MLTTANTQSLTLQQVQQIKADFRKLRRRKFARGWRGGFYCLEVTNEGKGWHLHIHALVDARWIDQAELSTQWKIVTSGRGYIVHVRDARSVSYLAEVTKYVVKGNQLAAWTPTDIASFIDAFQNQRTFGVFGQLFGKRTEWAEWIKQFSSAKPKCDCGSPHVCYYTEAEWEWKLSQPTCACRPPPKLLSQLAFPADEHQSNLDAIKQ